MSNNLCSKIFLNLVLIFSFICVATPARAETYIDDFSTSDSLQHYTVYPNGGSVSIESGLLKLTSPYGNRRFPYITFNDNGLVKPYKKIDVTFKYASIGRFGAGISVDDNYPVNGNPYDLGHQSLIWTWNWDSPPKSRFGYYSFIYQDLLPQNDYHTLSISGESGLYSIYLDGIFLKSINSTKSISSLWLGNPEIVNTSDEWPTIHIDRIQVIDSAVEIPTFPYLSQKNPTWGSKEYDSAEDWAGMEKSGIDRWGCALTSVAMILQKNGVKTIDGNTDVNPDNLNTWLKGQTDGYIGPGLINWIAITRYTRESFAAGHATTKLEYERSYLPTTPVLPAILGVPGHFVVAYDEDTTNWMINDPASTTKTTLAKTSTIKSINRFIPSLTNLSYMMFTTSASASVTLKNELGDIVPVTWTEEYLSDDIDATDGSKLKVGMVAKPENGQYRLETSQDPDISSELHIYLYDDLAQVTPQTFVLDEVRNVFEINYGQDPESSRTTTEIDITPPLPPTILSPADHAHVNTNGLILDWSDVTDPSAPVTYNYKSTWPGGSYGPVSTGTNSYINAPGTPDQTYLWQAQACDSVGNCSDWNTRTLIVDSTRPTADIVFPTPGPSSNYFEVVFSELVNPVEATSGANYFLSNWPEAGGSGDLVGDANITYNQDNKTARILFTNPGWYISPEQLWGVQNIHDPAGNLLSTNPYTEYSTPMTAPVLASAPTVTPNPTNQISQTWSWLTAADVGSGVKGYSTRTYDAVSEQFLSDWLWIGKVLGTSTSLSEGSWRLSLRATDNAGNVSTALDSSTLLVDRTTPSTPTNLHFDNPNVTCGGFTKEKLVTIDWDDSNDNTKIAGYEYNVDYPLGDKRGSWTTFFTSSSYRGSLNEGIHYIKLRSKDTAGNYSTWSNSCAITYDSLAPIFKEKTSFSGWYTQPQTSYFDFTDANLTDDYLAPSCEINTEGSAQVCESTPNVCDKAGNCYTTQLTSSSAKIDLTKPTVRLNAWGSTIDGTASDSTSGIDRVEIKIVKPDHSESTVTAAGTTSWTYTMSEAPYGNYKIYVTSIDIAGNRSDELAKEFVMSPVSQTSTPSNSGAVQGVSTEGITEKKLVRSAITPVVEEEENPTTPPAPSISPTPNPSGEDVLGEATTVKNINYWWLIIPVIIVLGYGVSRALKSTVRRD